MWIYKFYSYLYIKYTTNKQKSTQYQQMNKLPTHSHNFKKFNKTNIKTKQKQLTTPTVQFTKRNKHNSAQNPIWQLQRAKRDAHGARSAYNGTGRRVNGRRGRRRAGPSAFGCPRIGNAPPPSPRLGLRRLARGPPSTGYQRTRRSVTWRWLTERPSSGATGPAPKLR